MWTAGWQLVVVSGPQQGTAYPLDAPNVTVGRVRKGTQRAQGWVFLPDETVSGTQAKLRWNEARQTYTLINCSTTNPTTLNGNLCEEADLSAGDRLVMGRSTFEVVAQAPATAGETPADPGTRRVEPVRPPVSLPPFVLEVVEGPQQGSRHPIRGLVVALGGTPVSGETGRWYDQEVALPDASIPTHCLALRWKSQEQGFELTRRPGATPEVVIHRDMDELAWTASLAATRPALVRNQDVIQLGSSLLRLTGLPP